MSELKPCPFCGGSASIERMGTNRVSMQIVCDNCGCFLESGETWIDEHSKWNNRTESTELEQLRKERDELERLADNLLLKCVESDSDIADSDAWH